MYEIFELLLKENDISVYKFAKDTGIANSTLSSWKSGRSKLKIDKLQIIADYFEVTLNYLLGIKDEDNNLEQDTNVILGNLINEKRTELGLSLNDVANQLNISTKLLKKYESGTFRIDNKTLEKIATIFNMTFEQLLLELQLIIADDLDEIKVFENELLTIKKLLINNIKIRDLILSIEQLNKNEIDDLINYSNYIISKRDK